MKLFRTTILALLTLFLLPGTLSATKFLQARIVDREYLLLHFRDGEVHYRDSGTGESIVAMCGTSLTSSLPRSLSSISAICG